MLRRVSAAVANRLKTQFVSCVSIARKPPTQFFYVDDTVSFKRIVNLARQQPGTALVWRGDYLKGKDVYSRLAATQKTKPFIPKEELKSKTNLELFELQRDHRRRAADIRHALLVQLDSTTFEVKLENAPNVAEPCAEALKNVKRPVGDMLISFRDLQELQLAHQVRRRGVPVNELGDNAKIYPHFGVFWPARSDYRILVKTAPLEEHHKDLAIDVGTGTGCLALILAQRGIKRVIGTDIDYRAVECAKQNVAQYGFDERTIHIEECNLFPANLKEKASLIVFNPPWIPGEASSLAERAVFDTKDSKVLKDFLTQAAHQLKDNGEVWLLISDFAELLGLRKPGEMEAMICTAGLEVKQRMEVPATHPRAMQTASKTDILLRVRKQERISLWRLGKAIKGNRRPLTA